ncbi:hypothetical protein Ancab_007212 [Ancistrocladus abbreviatus]
MPPPRTFPFSVLFLSVHAFATGTLIYKCTTKNDVLFSAILMFGDSSVDTGNNNYISPIISINKADHPPYGKDFLNHIATGRFSNGKLVPDFLASVLGLKEIVPPFLDPNLMDQDLLTGVSFGSSGSGYDELTASSTGAIPMSKQIEYFKNYIEKVNGIVGEKKAKQIVQSALVVISAGANDFALNFYDLPTRRIQFNITGYQEFILKRLQNVIEELHDHGCRTMIISGLPPIGCLPIQITAKLKNPNERTCVDDQNSEAESYNQKLQKLLPHVEASLPGSRLFYANIYQPLTDLINHPQTYGIRVTDRGCCGTGYFEVGGLCNSITPTCQNASEYVFWDSVHPTEAAYQYIFTYLIQDIGPQLINDDNFLGDL